MANIGKEMKRPDAGRGSASSSAPLLQTEEISKDGLSIVSGGSEKLLDIVLVHGLNGHPKNTWTNPQSNFFWPTALGAGVPSARVMVFGYNTDIVPAVGSSHTRIRNIARTLLSQLRNKRQEDDEVLRPLVLVGHSLGGLVIKHALILASQDPGEDRGEIYRSVKAIMFFGTPNAGSIAGGKKRVQLLKKIAKVAFTEVPPKIESALELHSDELLDLADDFRRLDICKNNRLLVYTFYETVPTKMLGELVVDETSARVNISGEEPLPIDANHSDMVKFKDEKDMNYENVIVTVKRLQRIIKSGTGIPRLSQASFMISGHNLMPLGPEFNGLLDELAIPTNQSSQKTSYFEIPNEKRVSGFVGRTDILATISNFFEPVASSEQKTPLTLALFGMGGIGKTQIALQYCLQVHQTNKFETVFWIDAHSEQAVVASLGKIATKTNQHKQQSTSVREKALDMVAALQTWPHPFLLVFDNLDDPEFDNILQYTPAVGAGAILFTSRLSDTGNLFDSSMNVDVMDQKDALNLLRLKSGSKGALTKDEEINAHKIIGLLDGLPLAIDQAGAYIRASGNKFSFQRFLDHYSQRKKHILEYFPKSSPYREASEDKTKERCLSVFTTWDLSLKHLGSSTEDHDMKTRFLTVAAFLGGQRVSRLFFKTQVLTLQASKDPQETDHWKQLFESSSEFDDLLFRDVVVELNNLSLIRGFTESDAGDLHFTIHPLVREWVMLRIEKSQQLAFTSEVNSIMFNVLETYESILAYSPDFDRMVSDSMTEKVGSVTHGHLIGDMIQETVAHCHACIQLAQDFGPEFDGSNNLEFYIASLLGDTGEYEEAVEIFQRILKHTNETLGDQHDVTLMLSTVISRLLVQYKARVEDRASMEKLLVELENFRGKAHPQTLAILHSLIDLYFNIGEVNLSIASLMRLKETVLNTELENTDEAMIVALLAARKLASSGFVADAEKIVDLVSKKLEPDDISSAGARMLPMVLCEVQIVQDKPAVAQKTIQDFINRETNRLGGRTSSDILSCELILAKCHAAQGQWEAAVQAATPVHSFSAKVLGPCHQLTLICAILLAQYWMKFQPEDLSPSEEIVEKLLADFATGFGDSHPATMTIKCTVAVSFSKGGGHARALSYMKDLYDNYRETLDPAGELRLSIEDEYASCISRFPHRAQEDVDKMRDMFTVRQERFEDKDGPKSPLAMRNRQKFAVFLYNVDEYVASLPGFETQMTFSKEVYGPDREEFDESCMCLARCYRSLCRWPEALELLSSIYKWRANKFGVTDERTSDALLTSARINQTTKNFALAEDQYTEVVEQMSVRHGRDHEKTMNCLISMAHMICNQNKAGDCAAEPLYRRLLEWRLARFGTDSKEVTIARGWVANCMVAKNKDVEAVKFYKQVLDWQQKNLGPDHDDTMESTRLLGMALVWSKDFGGGRQYVSRAAEWLKRTKGPGDTQTLTCCLQLGQACGQLGLFAEAKEHISEVLAQREVINGPSDGKTMKAVLDLRDVVEAMGDYAEAEPYAMRIVEWYKAGNATEATQVLEQYSLGYLRLRQGRAAEAEESIARCLAWKKEHFGLADARTIRTCFWHAQCQYALGKIEAACECYAIVVEWKECPKSWEQYLEEAKVRLEDCRSRSKQTAELPCR